MTTSIHSAQNSPLHLKISLTIIILFWLRNNSKVSFSSILISLTNIRLTSLVHGLYGLNSQQKYWKIFNTFWGIFHKSTYFFNHLLSIWLNHFLFETNFTEMFWTSISSFNFIITLICTWISALCDHVILIALTYSIFCISYHIAFNHSCAILLSCQLLNISMTSYSFWNHCLAVCDHSCIRSIIFWKVGRNKIVKFFS